MIQEEIIKMLRIIKNNKSLIKKVLAVFAIVAVLAWIVFAGGCLGSERVKLIGGAVRIEITILAVSSVALIILLFSEPLYFVSKRTKLCSKELVLISLKLLI